MKKIQPKAIYGTLKKISGTCYFEVVSPFYWLLDYEDKDGWCIDAKEGFRSNFGSIPRFMWWIFDPTKYNSYILHDSAYARQVKYHMGKNTYALLTRKEADMMLLEGLAYEGATFLEKLCIYTAVRLFGWIAWL